MNLALVKGNNREGPSYPKGILISLRLRHRGINRIRIGDTRFTKRMSDLALRHFIAEVHT